MKDSVLNLKEEKQIQRKIQEDAEAQTTLKGF